MIECNQIAIIAAQLQERFAKCRVLRAEDMDLLVDLILAVQTCTASSIVLDNIPLVTNFGSVFPIGDSLPINVINKVNSLPLFTVEENQILVLTGISHPIERSSISFEVTYIVNGKGKGTYGTGGGIQLTTADLQIIENKKIDFGGTTPPIVDNDPNSFVKDLGEIDTQNVVDVINNSNEPFVITTPTNWYFEYTANGSRVLYGFRGNNGTYGSGASQITIADLFLIYDEDNLSTEFEGYTEQGTRGGSDLIVKIGDYDETGESKRLVIDNTGLDLPITSFSDFKIDQGNLIINQGAGDATISPDNITADRTYQLPDNSGTIALLSDLGSTTGGAFENTDEGSGNGIFKVGRDPNNFGPIGSNAMDLSTSSGTSIVRGATGTNSFAIGSNVEASGHGSTARGSGSLATGTYSIAHGYNTTASNYLSTSIGLGHSVSGPYSTGFGVNAVHSGAYGLSAGIGLINKSTATAIFGQGNLDYTNTSTQINIDEAPLLVVGNGSIAVGSPNTVATRSDAFNVLYSGLVLAPSLEIADIDAETTGKVLLTREWYESKDLDLQTVTDNSTQVNGGAFTTNNITIDNGSNNGRITFGTTSTGSIGWDDSPAGGSLELVSNNNVSIIGMAASKYATLNTNGFGINTQNLTVQNTAFLRTNNITTQRLLELPDSDGILVNTVNSITPSTAGNVDLSLDNTLTVNNVTAQPIIMQSATEQELIFQRLGTVGDQLNPVFSLGRIINGGINEAKLRFVGRDDSKYTTERAFFEMETGGTVASLREVEGSHYEGFIGAEQEPMFRISSTNLGGGNFSSRIELGSGGTNPTDVFIERQGPNQLGFVLSGGTKQIIYPDSVFKPSNIVDAFQNSVTPSIPGAGVIKVYNKDGQLTQLDENGVESSLVPGVLEVLTSSRATIGTHVQGIVNNEAEAIFKIESFDFGGNNSSRILFGEGGSVTPDVALERQGTNTLGIVLGGAVKVRYFADTILRQPDVADAFQENAGVVATPNADVKKIFNRTGVGLVELGGDGVEKPVADDIYNTFADLPVATTLTVGKKAIVTNDPVVDNNGEYIVTGANTGSNGTTWIKTSGQKVTTGVNYTSVENGAWRDLTFEVASTADTDEVINFPISFSTAPNAWDIQLSSRLDSGLGDAAFALISGTVTSSQITVNRVDAVDNNDNPFIIVRVRGLI